MSCTSLHWIFHAVKIVISPHAGDYTGSHRHLIWLMVIGLPLYKLLHIEQ